MSCDLVQWSESLELVAHGLKENDVQFLHGKDQKSLQVLLALLLLALPAISPTHY